MGKECRTCVFNTKKESCKMLTERIKNCWAWADEEEYQRREDEIEAYKATHTTVIAEHGSKWQKLIDGFMELYEQGFSDVKIGELLEVHQTTVGRYRNGLGLPYNRKNKIKKSLRQQANKK